MIAAFAPGSDLKRFYRGTLPRLALIVVAIIPLFYGALYLWAFWNPFGNVNNLPVAIIDLDEPAEAEGQTVHAGPTVASGIIDSHQLKASSMSYEEGTAALKHGHVAFTITIPEDFSASIVSAATGDPRQAVLHFTFNDANNYLDSIIGGDAAEEVINTVTAQVGEQVFEAVFTGIKGELPKIKQAAAGIEELAAGSDEINAAIDEIVGAVDEAVAAAENAIAHDGLTNAQITQIIQTVEAGTNDLANALDAIAAFNQKIADDTQAMVNDLRNSEDPIAQDVGDRLQALHDEVQANPRVQEAQAIFADVKGGLDALAAEFNNPDSRVNIVVGLIESGQIPTILTDVKAKASELGSGMAQIAGGVDELNAGVQAGLKLIPHWDNAQQANFIKVLADPVVLKETTHNEAKTFAYGFAPFFFGLALFVGALISWMLFTPIQTRALTQGLNPFRVVLTSFAPTLVMGLIQATILFLVVRFALGMEYDNFWGTLGFMWLTSTLFLSMIQMFNAILGTAVGRITSLILLMFMLTSAGGIYPVALTSPLFQYLHWIDPMTATVTGLRFMILGGADYRFWVATGVISLAIIVFLTLTTVAARKDRQGSVDKLYFPPIVV